VCVPSIFTFKKLLKKAESFLPVCRTILIIMH